MKHEVILKLLEAKRHSDKANYLRKSEIVKELLRMHPKQFKIDSRQTHTVGLTHMPSGFKIHATKGTLPPEFLELQKAAGLPPGLVNLLAKGVRGVGAMKKMWNPNALNPTYGQAAATQARRGLHTLMDGNDTFYKPGLVSKMIPSINKISDPTQLAKSKGLLVDLFGANSALEQPAAEAVKNIKGLNYKPLSMAPSDATKLDEVAPNIFGKHIPPTEPLDAMLSRNNLSWNNHKGARQALNTENPNGWLVKDINGAAGQGITTDQSKNFKLPQMTGNNMVQQRRPLKQVFDPTSPTGKVNQEFRVHVLNGKVVPHATLERGQIPGTDNVSYLRGIKSMLLPGRSVSQVEDYSRQVMSDVKHKAWSKGAYGMDVAIGADGKPFLIEANPTLASGPGAGASSYLLNNPLIQQAHAAAIKGQVPGYVLARRGLYGAAAAGATTAGAQELTPDAPPPPPPHTPWEGLMSRIKQLVTPTPQPQVNTGRV